MSINREWHLKHRMPKNPTEKQRTDWHVAHAKHCDCRPAPEWVQKIIKQQKRLLPAI
jgi:hypothetical protein